jgi:hypothetical protein
MAKKCKIIVMQRGVISGTAIALIVAIVLLFMPGRMAQAADTTLVISVSIGGGVAVGMVGWLIHLTYSQRVAHDQPQPYGFSARAGTGGEALNLGGLQSGLNKNQAVFLSENSPPERTAIIRLVELPW